MVATSGCTLIVCWFTGLAVVAGCGFGLSAGTHPHGPSLWASVLTVCCLGSKEEWLCKGEELELCSFDLKTGKTSLLPYSVAEFQGSKLKRKALHFNGKEKCQSMFKLCFCILFLSLGICWKGRESFNYCSQSLHLAWTQVFESSPLLPRVLISRNLELETELVLELMHSIMRYRHPKGTLVC